MDAAMVWLTFVAACAGVAGAVIAWVQARTAISARQDAQSAEGAAIAARDAAVKAQQESAGAAQRIADALEQRIADERAASAVRPDPWQIRRSHSQHGGRLTIVNSGSLEVEDVRFDVERSPYVTGYDPSPAPTTYLPGDAVIFYYQRAGADSRTSVLTISWRWADEEQSRETRITID